MLVGEDSYFKVHVIDKKEAFLNRDRKKQVKGDDELYLWYYLLLCFAAIWSMGGILTDKNDINYKRNFSDWFTQNFKLHKIPPKGTIFDYYLIMGPEKKDLKNVQKNWRNWISSWREY